MDEPIKAAGLFGKVMAEASARAKEYRAQESTGIKRNVTKSDDWPEREATIKGCPPAKWGKTFEAFDVKLPGALRAADAAYDMAQGTWKPWCLVLSGGYGTGKTHLAYAAANYRRERRLPYLMLTAPALMAKLKNAIDEKKLSVENHGAIAWGPDDWVRMYSETPALLIIDDLGAHQDTEWATAQVFSILNARYDAGLPTMITTNLAPKQMDPRISSRCAQGIVVCNGADQRVRYG